MNGVLGIHTLMIELLSRPSFVTRALEVRDCQMKVESRVKIYRLGSIASGELTVVAIPKKQELDFAINRDGLVEASHAAMYPPDYNRYQSDFFPY